MRQRSLPILLVEPDVPISGTGFPRLVFNPPGKENMITLYP